MQVPLPTPKLQPTDATKHANFLRKPLVQLCLETWYNRKRDKKHIPDDVSEIVEKFSSIGENDNEFLTYSKDENTSHLSFIWWNRSLDITLRPVTCAGKHLISVTRDANDAILSRSWKLLTLSGTKTIHEENDFHSIRYGTLNAWDQTGVVEIIPLNTNERNVMYFPIFGNDLSRDFGILKQFCGDHGIVCEERLSEKATAFASAHCVQWFKPDASEKKPDPNWMLVVVLHDDGKSVTFHPLIDSCFVGTYHEFWKTTVPRDRNRFSSKTPPCALKPSSLQCFDLVSCYHKRTSRWRTAQIRGRSHWRNAVYVRFFGAGLSDGNHWYVDNDVRISMRPMHPEAPAPKRPERPAFHYGVIAAACIVGLVLLRNGTRRAEPSPEHDSREHLAVGAQSNMTEVLSSGTSAAGIKFLADVFNQLIIN